MNFREFITNRWYRRFAANDLARYENIKPPANPSRRYIGKLVHGLLDELKARRAEAELSNIGPAAVPSLAAAIRDSRFHRTQWPKCSQTLPPLDAVLALLAEHGAEHILEAAAPLVDSPSDEVRKAAALYLASSGRVETIPLLGGLLQDADSYVRSYVCMGIRRALTASRAHEEFRRQAYDLLLPQCEQKWHTAGNEAPKAIVALDPIRAAADFANARWLSNVNPNVHLIMAACNEKDIPLPATFVRGLLDHSLPQAVGERCYPHQYVAAACFESLSLSLGEQARPLLESALNNEQDIIQEAAAAGIVRLAGLNDPVWFVSARAQEEGFERLTNAQRVVFCASAFDAQVCNGGIMQFFGNSSGDHAADTLDALRELEHTEAAAALASAIKLVGPLARERDREMRLAAFEDRYDELQSAFDPLERAYYDAPVSLMKKMLLYAARHAEHFRG